METAESFTPAQQLFWQLHAMAEDLQVPVTIRTEAIGRALIEQGHSVSGFYRVMEAPEGTDLDKEINLLQVDGLWMDAQGAYASREAVLAHRADKKGVWLEWSPSSSGSPYVPSDPDWLGHRFEPSLRLATSQLQAECQRQQMGVSTVPSRSAVRAARL